MVMAKTDCIKTCPYRHSMVTINIYFPDIRFVANMNGVNPDQTTGVLLPHQIRDFPDGRN